MCVCKKKKRRKRKIMCVLVGYSVNFLCPVNAMKSQYGFSFRKVLKMEVKFIFSIHSISKQTCKVVKCQFIQFQHLLAKMIMGKV